MYCRLRQNQNFYRRRPVMAGVKIMWAVIGCGGDWLFCRRKLSASLKKMKRGGGDIEVALLLQQMPTLRTERHRASNIVSRGESAEADKGGNDMSPTVI